MSSNVPQTFLEALKLAVKLEEERIQLKQQNEQLSEALHYQTKRADENQMARELQDQMTLRKVGQKIGRAAKCLNVEGLGRNKLFKFLRDVGILFYDSDGYNSVKQSYINQKYFFEYLDETYEYPVIYITPKGMRFVLKKLVNYGYQPKTTAEEWERKCQQMSDEVDYDE